MDFVCWDADDTRRCSLGEIKTEFYGCHLWKTYLILRVPGQKVAAYSCLVFRVIIWTHHKRHSISMKAWLRCWGSGWNSYKDWALGCFSLWSLGRWRTPYLDLKRSLNSVYCSNYLFVSSFSNSTWNSAFYILMMSVAFMISSSLILTICSVIVL